MKFFKWFMQRTVLRKQYRAQRREEKQQKLAIKALSVEEKQLQAQLADLEKQADQQQQGGQSAFAHGLSKTRQKWLSSLLQWQNNSSAEALSEQWKAIEKLLLEADVGPSATQQLLAEMQQQVGEKTCSATELVGHLKQAILTLIQPLQEAPMKLTELTQVILLTGVNGAGKTTTIGKLGAYFQSLGAQPLLVAGDTFRAAANEQLALWAERIGCAFYGPKSIKSSTAVIYQGIEQAAKTGSNLVLCDTAGRLNTQKGLMDELARVQQVCGKALEGAPHQTWLVMDANAGQNALRQVEDFSNALQVDGLILTKLDGTARGGMVVGVAGLVKSRALNIPIRFIGTGEQQTDLYPFDANQFVDSLLGGSDA